MRIFFLFGLFLFSDGLHAQDKERLHFSLKNLPTTTNDTLKVFYLNNIGWDTSYDNLALGLKYCQQALALAEQIKYDRGIAYVCNSIGTIYQDMGDANKALSYQLRGLRLSEKDNRKHSIVTACVNISFIYTSQGDYQNALKYLLRAKNICEEFKDSAGLAAIYTTLGTNYLGFPDSTQKAVDYYKKGIKIYSALHKLDGVAIDLAGLAKCDEKLGDTLSADIEMNRAIAIVDSMHIDYEVSQYMVNYAEMLNQRGRYAKAQDLLLKGLVIYRKIVMIEEEKDLWNELADVYEKSGQLQKSINAWKRFSKLRDSLMNENTLRHQRELEAVYENEKKENEIKLLTQKATLSKTITISLVGGCLLLLLFLFVLFKRSQLRKETNIQLEKQNAVIEEKNKDITDSITYARRIQEAILPAKELKYRIFPDAFILYQPRDIVSGDFYWFTEKNGKRLIAAVDCTGHGVPGAFMSMIANAFLNEIVNEKGITKPSEILNLLRQNVVNALKQSDTHSENKDGMDIALCSFREDFSSVEFAGAFNPLWLVRNGEVKIFAADKEPVGFQSQNSTPFTNHTIELQKGDSIYIFSDGFADQFGGPKGKKFKYSFFQKTLLDIQHKSMVDQEKELLQIFSEWRGNLDQVDDVIVIGIRI